MLWPSMGINKAIIILTKSQIVGTLMFFLIQLTEYLKFNHGIVLM